jgi:hypothetical protein
VPKIEKKLIATGKRLGATLFSSKIPTGLRKMLSQKRGLGVILFEENDHGKWCELKKSGLESEVKVPRADGFNINLAENDLDVYRSPFVLNLRKLREKGGVLIKNETHINYRDLPGGEWLEKIGFFSFFDFSQSEIITYYKQKKEKVAYLFRRFYQQPNFFNKLSQDIVDLAKVEKHWSILEQILLIRLIVSLYGFFYRIYILLYKSYWLGRVMLLRFFHKDETLWLAEKKIFHNLDKKLIIDRILAMSQTPTISEIIKSGNFSQINKEMPIKSEIKEEKFKLIKAVDKKEVRIKYLRDNFTRRGVVVNEQKPSAFWPKESLNWDLSNFVFSFNNLKKIAVFCGILIALASSVKILSYWEDLMSAKGMVMGEAEMALENISEAESGLKLMDFDLARKKFQEVNDNFSSAKKQLDNISSFITILAEVAPSNNTFKSGSNLIDLGSHLAKAADYLLAGITEISETDDLSLTSRINNFSLELNSAISELELGLEKSQNIGLSHLPKEHKERFIQLKDSLPTALAGLKNLKELTDFSAQVLGEKELKRYVLVFQNTNEMRGTGGFMGSFARVDFRSGEIDRIFLPAGGTYDMRTWFNELLVAPRPLQLINPRWEFQDANWWPDFPKSAENIKRFYEKAGGPTVDGVIAINSDFFGELLKVTGPIDLPDYGKTLTAENFDYELQKSIELEAEDKTKPKKILGELAPIVLDRILKIDKKNIFDIAQVVNSGLLSKDIQFYFSDEELQKFVLERNWAGAIDRDTASDYLMISGTNIGGGKTDNVIDQETYLKTEIHTDGRIVNNLLISRRNIGPIDEFTDLKNNSYLRFYVPLGSKLIKAVGFDSIPEEVYKPIDPKLKYLDKLKNESLAIIDSESKISVYEENGKTVFSTWSMLQPGVTKEVLLVYELPFRLNFKKETNILKRAANLFTSEISSYSLRLQKQSGRSDDKFIAEIVYPSDLSLKLSYPEINQSFENRAVFHFLTDTDKYLVAGFINK